LLFEKYRNAYTTLANAVPQVLSAANPLNFQSSTANISSDPVLYAEPWPRQSDFTPEELEKMFWKRVSWTAYHKNGGISGLGTVKGKRGRTRAAEGINVKMLYIVSKDGEPIDGHQASEMRSYARFIWNDLSNSSKAPQKWVTGTSITIVEGFRRQMQTRFPELRLCEGGWKVDQIGIDYYSSWRLAKQKKGTFNVEGAGHDNEDNDDDDDDDDEPKTEIDTADKENHTGSTSKSKRKAAVVNAPAPKKRRAHETLAPKSSTEKTKTPAAKSDTERTGSSAQNVSRPVPTPRFMVGQSSRSWDSYNSPRSC
jgi:hypothetical protein